MGIYLYCLYCLYGRSSSVVTHSFVVESMAGGSGGRNLLVLFNVWPWCHRTYGDETRPYRASRKIVSEQKELKVMTLLGHGRMGGADGFSR